MKSAWLSAFPKRRIRALMIIIISVAVLSLSLQISNTSAINQNSPRRTSSVLTPISSIAFQQPDVLIPKTNLSMVVFDGNISDNEYSGFYYDSGTEMSVFWEHDGENLTAGLVSHGTGWVSLGIGAVMNGSNMIMGGEVDGTPYCRDLYGQGWNHVNDTSLPGGTFDVLEWDAEDNGTHTTFEFRIPLNATDALDMDMQENGTYPIFLGYQATEDGILTYHSGHSGIIQARLQPLGNYMPTSIALTIMPTSIEHGDEIVLSTILSDENQNPLSDFAVNFFRKTEFGDAIIGNDTTDTNGNASISYQNSDLTGIHIFGARFEGLVTVGAGSPLIYEG
ncbi:MAG: DOMON domain-containing protein, partial [Candidatus Hodarchaeales archaeon]